MTRGFLAAALLLATGSRAVADPADCGDASQLARDPAGDRLSTVYFDAGSAAVTGAERAALRDAVDWQRQHPQRLLVVEGHTDRSGSWRTNLRLSQQRAEAVRDQLEAAGGDPLRIVVSAFSENEAIRGGPACNRRVVVRGTDRAFPELVQEQREADRPQGAAERPPRAVARRGPTAP